MGPELYGGLVYPSAYVASRTVFYILWPFGIVRVIWTCCPVFEWVNSGFQRLLVVDIIQTSGNGLEIQERPQR
jgi:hypothetical protein